MNGQRHPPETRAKLLLRCDDDTLKSADWLLQWEKLIDDASTRIGKKFNVAETLKQKLLDAGYRDVQDRTYRVFICPSRLFDVLIEHETRYPSVIGRETSTSKTLDA